MAVALSDALGWFKTRIVNVAAQLKASRTGGNPDAISIHDRWLNPAMYGICCCPPDDAKLGADEQKITPPPALVGWHTDRDTT